MTLGIFIFLITFGSCNKTDERQDLILGKWISNSLQYKVTDSEGVKDSITIYSTLGAYIDFRNDGRAFSFNKLSIGIDSNHKIDIDTIDDATVDTFLYQKIHNKLIITTDTKDTLQILNLTEIKLSLRYYKTLINSDDKNKFIMFDFVDHYTK